MPAAPSTASPNPLKQAMASIVGTDPLSTTTGTSNLVNYEGGGGFRPPAGDVIAITGDPGTGATTAETWAHDIALENQRRALASTQFEERLKTAEEARQVAGEARQSGMYGPQLAAANLANQAAQQQYAINKAAEDRAARQFYLTTEEPLQRYMQAARNVQEKRDFMGGRPITPEGDRQYNAWKASGGQIGRGRNTYDPRVAWLTDYAAGHPEETVTRAPYGGDPYQSKAGYGRNW